MGHPLAPPELGPVAPRGRGRSGETGALSRPRSGVTKQGPTLCCSAGYATVSRPDNLFSRLTLTRPKGIRTIPREGEENRTGREAPATLVSRGARSQLPPLQAETWLLPGRQQSIMHNDTYASDASRSRLWGCRSSLACRNSSPPPGSGRCDAGAALQHPECQIGKTGGSDFRSTARPTHVDETGERTSRPSQRRRPYRFPRRPAALWAGLVGVIDRGGEMQRPAYRLDPPEETVGLPVLVRVEELD
jgi:hypothetical protein